MELRTYQRDAVEAVYRHLRERDDNPVVVLPTAAGKTPCLAEICKDAVTKWNGRVLVLAHVKELLEQAADKLRKICPEVKFGVYSAGLKRRDTDSPVIIAGIQSVYRRACELDAFDLVVVDECFPAGTQIDGRPIESIQVGERVRSFNHRTNRIELRRVLAVSKRPAPDRMIKVTLRDGRQIISTPDHPFFNGKTYVAAKGIVEDAVVYVPRVRMRHPRTECEPISLLSNERKTVLLEGMLDQVRPSAVLAAEGQVKAKEGQAAPTKAMEDAVVHVPRVRERRSRTECEPIQGISKNRQNVLQQELRLSVPGKALLEANVTVQSHGESVGSQEGLNQYEAGGAQTATSGRQGQESASSTGTTAESSRGGVDARVGNQDGVAETRWQSNLVLGRSCTCRTEGLCGGRRWQPQDPCSAESGCEERSSIVPVGVDHVEVSERGCSLQSERSRREHHVYNLQVEGNQNYFAEGVLVHNCHLIPRSGDGMYRQLLADAKVVNPELRVVGFTATPFRLDSGPICSPDHFLNAICFEIGIKELIRDGYLCPLVTKAGATKVDTSQLHVRGGEFVSGEVEELMDHDELVEAACAEIVAHTQNRNACLIFAAGIQHGRHIVRVFREKYGIECGFVCGETPTDERGNLLARFRGDGEPGLFERDPLKYLCNVNVLTTGFDAPNIDCVALLRPTASPGLYYQALGRGFRLHAAKQNCLVLDFGGNALRHGPVDQLQIQNKNTSGAAEAPAKECPECNSLVATGYAVCPDCGYEFSPPERQSHEAEASDAGVLSGQVTDRVYEVRDVVYRVHTKRDAPPDAPRSMRVDYCLGLDCWQSEWICFEHTGYARRKAEHWWRQRSPEPVPDTAERAVEIAESGGVCWAHEITVRSVAGDKYDRVVDHVLGDMPEPCEGRSAIEDDLDDIPF